MQSPGPTFYDQENFPEYFTPEVIEEYKSVMETVNSRNSRLWLEYVDSIGGTENIDLKSKQLKKLVRGGISPDLRTVVWCKLTGTSQKMRDCPGVYHGLLEMGANVPERVKATIEVDIPRTFVHAKTFTSEQLRNVLYAFAIVHPEIGYCQSLNFIAAILISIVGEEPAFWILCTIVEKYLPANYFCGGLEGFKADLLMMESLFNERVPDIAKLAQRVGHEWVVTASGWILTLFSNSFPVSTVLRIWDAFFLEGGKIIFRVAVAALKLRHDQLMKSESRAMICKVLNNFQNDMVDQEALMELAFKLKAFSKKHLIGMRNVAMKKVKGLPDTEKKMMGMKLWEILGRLDM